MAHLREFQRQLSCKIETTKGTAIALTDADDAKVRIVNAKHSVQPERFQQDHHREAFEMPPDLVGTLPCEFTFGVPMVGHSGGVGSEPEFSKLFKACGYTSAVLTKIDLTGTVTGGPFFHGETVTGGTSTETGSVFFDTYTGATVMYVTSASGSFTDGETLTGGTSGATVTVDTPAGDAAAGYGWAPITAETSHETLTMELFLGGKVVKMYGAMGTASIPFNFADRCVAEFTFRGILSTVSDESNPSGILYPTKQTPPLFKAATFNVNSAGSAYSTHEITQLSADIGNDLVVLRDANTSSGLKHGFVQGRTSSVSIDPWATLNSEQNLFLKSLQNGIANQAMVEWMLGTSAGNRFKFQVPAGRLEAPTDGAREGLATEEFRVVASGGNVYGSTGDQLGANMGLLFAYI